MERINGRPSSSYSSILSRFCLVRDAVSRGQSNFCVCMRVFPLLHLFSFFRETGRATIARPRRVFQFTLYRGQIAR